MWEGEEGTGKEQQKNDPSAEGYAVCGERARGCAGGGKGKKQKGVEPMLTVQHQRQKKSN